ncbi:MAG: sigma-70 family RNA polymerase sigma factor [Deltaproteobacteria bacterium]|nr:sigma-70 family RNA polymerase sigma factor [Deltaproteobacteria bacterium]
MEEDFEFVRATLDGDFSAFERLVDKYHGKIYRHLRKMVSDASVAEDLLQDTFLSAYRGLQGFNRASSFSTWLFRIATNAALMYLRRERPETVEYDDRIMSELADVLTPSPEFVSTPLEILLSMEGKAKIEQAIEQLPVIYRSVVILRDVEGFSLEEVATIVGASIPAVKSRLHRARNIVRESLTSYYIEKRSPRSL